MLLVLFAVSGVVGLAVVIGVIALTRGGGNSSSSPSGVAAEMRAAGCKFTTAKATSRQHVTSLAAENKYHTTPPSNGSHYYSPAVWGFYTTPANPVQVVHNEEHGGVILWWGSKVPQSTIDQLRSFYDSSPNAILVTPIENATPGITYPPHKAPGSNIYLSAWTTEIKDGTPTNGKNVIATCPRFDEKAFTAFRDQFRGKGPERFPVGNLTPGT